MDTNPPAVCSQGGARVESRTQAGRGRAAWVRGAGVSAGTTPAHSSFLAGTRVRAMMIGTRARPAMPSAHRGR